MRSSFLARLLLSLCSAALVTTKIGAAVILPNLPVGSVYELIFVTTGTHDGAWDSDNPYNAIATAEGSTIAGLPANLVWNAVASYNLSGDASLNAPSFPNVPIYNTQGIEVATGAMGLYSGTLLHPVEYNATGAITTASFVWTGSAPNGGAWLGGLGRGTDTGMVIPPIVGNPMATDGTWLFDTSLPDSTQLPLYALSYPIRVTPEPSTVILAALGALALLTCRRRRA
jgi:hypothetical protein